MNVRAYAIAVAVVAGLAAPRVASAEWRPPDLRPTAATLRDVLAAYAKASGTPDARYAQRRERWTYASGGRRYTAHVAVRGDDERVDVDLGERVGTFSGGRLNGVPWRADANGIAHETLSDDQGDAADRVPRSIFLLARDRLSIAGESQRDGAWVVLVREPRDKPRWLFIDRGTGRVVRETMREGARTIVTTFDDVRADGTMLRPHRWHVADGDAAHDLDVTIGDVEPGTVPASETEPPIVQRTFAANTPAAVTLPARFAGDGHVWIDVDVDGEQREFVLDTGTASVTLDAGLARRRHWPLVLEHATVPRMAAGALAMSNVSTLAIPLGGLGYSRLGGILGFDFFAGHVVHVDYAARRVDVMSDDAAAPVFRDPANTVFAASFEEGVPIVQASVGTAAGDRFVLDTGSAHPLVLAPLLASNAAAAGTWPATRFPWDGATSLEEFLEGSIVVAAHRVPVFTLPYARFHDVVVGTQIANARADAIDVALDGIVGTDQMRGFSWWFDYDHDRIAIRRNA